MPVLDTNVALYYLGGKLAGPIALETCFISIITEIELLSYPRITHAEESAINELLSIVSVTGITDPVKDTAIRLRREYRLKLPDAVIAATAFALRTELISNDLIMAGIPALDVRQPALKTT